MEQDKKKVQSMAEVMKNPTKVVLLQVLWFVGCMLEHGWVHVIIHRTWLGACYHA